MKIKEAATNIIDDLLSTETEFTDLDLIDRRFHAAGLTGQLDLLATRDTVIMLGYAVVGHYVYRPVH